MKQCPFCAEEIQDAAIVCKHCGRELRAGATAQVQIVAPKQKTSLAAWGCLTIIVLVGINVVGTMFCSTSAPPATSKPPAKAAPVSRPAQSSPGVTAEDLKREKTGTFGSRKVSALEKNGTWIVTFEPALPRDDRAVLDGAEYALREMLGVNTNNATWRPVDKFMRIITGSGAYDVLLLRNEKGTVQGMTIIKR